MPGPCATKPSTKPTTQLIHAPFMHAVSALPHHAHKPDATSRHLFSRPARAQPVPRLNRVGRKRAVGAQHLAAISELPRAPQPSSNPTLPPHTPAHKFPDE